MERFPRSLGLHLERRLFAAVDSETGNQMRNFIQQQGHRQGPSYSERFGESIASLTRIAILGK